MTTPNSAPIAPATATASADPPQAEARLGPAARALGPHQPIQSTLYFKRRVTITPHYIRVFLGGEGLERFVDCTVGANNKIFLVPRGAKRVLFPRLENGQLVLPPEDERPIIRTYTHRGVDLEAGELFIDFVAHGDEGPASAWALHAEEGDLLGVAMKPGQRPLVPPADFYLLAGDATAIPVLGAILERLPVGTRGAVVLEVHGPEDEQALVNPAGLPIEWLHNPTPRAGSTLCERVQALALPAPGESRFAYVAAEYRSVRGLRALLRRSRGFTAKELYAYSYWKAHAAEDASEADRRRERDEFE